MVQLNTSGGQYIQALFVDSGTDTPKAMSCRQNPCVSMMRTSLVEDTIEVSSTNHCSCGYLALDCFQSNGEHYVLFADVHEQRCADVRVKSPSNNVDVMDVTETLPAFVPILRL